MTELGSCSVQAICRIPHGMWRDMPFEGLWFMQGRASLGSVQGNKPCAGLPPAQQRLGLRQACCTIGEQRAILCWLIASRLAATHRACRVSAPHQIEA